MLKEGAVEGTRKGEKGDLGRGERSTINALGVRERRKGQLLLRSKARCCNNEKVLTREE